MPNTTAKIVIVMGVSGCGKSTVGKKLAEVLAVPFFDGDDFHPIENIEKMKNGLPLNDQDRFSWLQSLNTLAISKQEHGAVIACSALKQKYRDLIGAQLKSPPVWVYLKGSPELLHRRLSQRKGHFMPAGLLQSQFDALEPPINAIEVSIELNPNDIVKVIIERL